MDQFLRRRASTNHRRPTAQPRALEEKGREYIVPVRVHDTDFDGVSPTVAHLSLAEHSIDQVADLLAKKLKRIT